jgi:small redox-active disulfide protein 2
MRSEMRMRKIEVLGTGCAKCKRLEKNAREAVAELGIAAEVIKVEDMQEIVDRGVMMTPALYIDGEAMVVGRIPSVDEIKSMLKGP